ncbi:hypothetical protein MKY82_22130 [Paenibacillus sp. FSL W7-1279]|uniref:hypothetical protein n=1 Tax=Paenibacillus sp. FSL W7-1279 TaxID=2921697 RepID=UPI0030DC0453
MKLHSEAVRTGVINGKMYTAFFTELPNGQYLASVVGEATGSEGFGEHVTKMCGSKEEAVAAINDAWAELVQRLNRALPHQRHFTLRQGLSQTLLKLTQVSESIFRCHKCDGEVTQNQPNPSCWTCGSCKAEYMGPVLEK